MRYIVFDTETTSIDKPFCYDIGYIIADTESSELLCSRSFVVEQVWHNLPLFESAYYKDKRPLYVEAMRRHEMIMDKFGYITQQMYRDIKNYEVEHAFAYNSSFDERVFNFNCDWFKCINPFESLPIHDIRGFVHTFLVNDKYKAFCEEHQLFTEAGNYSTTAEAVYKYISTDTDFIEAHTALDDSITENEILKECFKYCIEYGQPLDTDYPVKVSIPRYKPHDLIIKVDDEEIYSGEYVKKTVYDGKYYFKTAAYMAAHPPKA